MTTSTRTRRWLTALSAVLLLAFVTVGARLVHVHELGGEWALSPSAAPPTVRYADREYRRGAELPPAPEATAVGSTPGGGAIYATTDPTPVTLWVQDDDRSVAYGLVGGP